MDSKKRIIKNNSIILNNSIGKSSLLVTINNLGMKKKTFSSAIMIAICIIMVIGCSQSQNNTKKSDTAIKGSDALTARQLFRKSGTDIAEDFAAVQSRHRFDVINGSSSHLMLVFMASSETQVSPAIVRLAPGGRQNVTMETRSDAKSFSLSYSVALSPKPFTTHTNRYRAYSDGETVMCVPVNSSHYDSLYKRTSLILQDSREEVTDKAMPAGTFIYTPGPYYRAAGIFARDFLYQLEGSGRDMVTAEEVKRAVDFHALKQLTENRKGWSIHLSKGGCS